MEENRIIMEFVPETPEEAAASRKQWGQFERNSKCLQEHILEIGEKYRGKTICVAGEELSSAIRRAMQSRRRRRRIPGIWVTSHTTSLRKGTLGSMLCCGEWTRCDDGIIRPMVNAEILAGDRIWRGVKFLLDTGADRTVLRAGVLDDLHLPHVQNVGGLGGVGGAAESVEIATQIRFRRDDDQWATFRGTYAAFLREDALDMSVLGRDILDIFAVIVDRGADE